MGRGWSASLRTLHDVCHGRNRHAIGTFADLRARARAHGCGGREEASEGALAHALDGKRGANDHLIAHGGEVGEEVRALMLQNAARLGY